MFWPVVYCVVHLALLARAVLRPHREPASRLAWVVVILALPIGGIVAYLLLGETNIGRRRAERMRRASRQTPSAALSSPVDHVEIPEQHVPLFRVGHTVNGFAPVAGNHGVLLADSNATIDSLVADIDASREHVHLTFYIWLPDNNGRKVVEALRRAAARNVTCRVMVDAVGSRALVSSEHWQALREAGVRVATALPIRNLLLQPLLGRIDLRNHRKNVVIDNHITYVGSQNCADPEFLIKARYAPWVDAMMRFTGPVARQNQELFLSDWMAQVDEDLAELVRQPREPVESGVVAQVIGTGPTVRYSAMPEVFESLMYAARRELVITTPYFVPDEAMLAALCASARRGVETTIIFPARNDSWVVAAASRSYYGDLLSAGVNVFEFEGGLLHAKTLTVDGELTLIGSANLDRRSFELNFENNVLFYDPSLTAQLRRRQEEYRQQSHRVSAEVIAGWSIGRRLWNNAVAMVGPIL